jgi:hypothetical protein
MLTWIAAYSNSQGLLVFPIMILIHQMVAPTKFVPGKWSVFWIVNLVVCYATYVPGVPLTGGPTPALLDFIAFILVYIGNPLGSLLWFSATVAPSNSTFVNGICGVLILGVSVVTACQSLPELQTRPEARIFNTFAAFTGACAVVTAWGRANGDDAIITAASSRYSIFAACLLYGLIFYYASKFARHEIKFATWHRATLAILLVATTVSYVRAVPVYAAYGSYDEWLAENYSTEIKETETSGKAFPILEFFLARKADLLRLGIGPYRSVAHTKLPIYAGKFVAALPLTPSATISQRFRTKFPVVRSISFQIVTWGNKPTADQVYWKALGRKNDAWATLGEGMFSTSGLSDWKTVTIRMSGSTEAEEVKVSFHVKDTSVQNPIGLALFASGADPLYPAEINGANREDGGKIGLTVQYDR